MARISVAYCEACRARAGFDVTPQKAIRKCHFCGSTKLCNMSSYSESRVKQVAKDMLSQNKRTRKNLALAVETAAAEPTPVAEESTADEPVSVAE